MDLILSPETSNNLTWVKAHHDNLFGRVESHWRREGTVFKWTVVIPANTSATVRIPADKLESVNESGKPIAAADGVLDAAEFTGYVTATVGAGPYEFSSRVKAGE